MEEVHKQFILGYVTTHCDKWFLLTGVYGMHIIADRQYLWSGLSLINIAVTKPLVIMGNFNTELYGDDRICANVVVDGEVNDFKHKVETKNMIEMRCMGRRYTWSDGNIYSKIDWILVNVAYVQRWEDTQGLIMDPLLSYHCPLSFTFDQQSSGPNLLNFLII